MSFTVNRTFGALPCNVVVNNGDWFKTLRSLFEPGYNFTVNRIFGASATFATVLPSLVLLHDTISSSQF